MNGHQPGEIIDGKYEILRLIGEGAMGAVYRGRHTLINKDVAIKILHGSVAANDEYRERFRREAEAAAKLSHPNICAATDFGEIADTGEFYMIMELLIGETLAKRIQRSHVLSPLSATRIAIQLLSALQCAANSGVIHRDVKPDNIYLISQGESEDDVVKLIDFGIAHHNDTKDAHLTTLTQAGAMYGTPQYISPEQINSHADIDQRADLYAVGVILYEMLTGAPPFVSNNYIELMHMHLKSPVPHLPQTLAYADAFDAMIQKLMAKDREARYGCAADVITDLNAILVHLSDRPLEQQLAALPLQQTAGLQATPIPALNAALLSAHAENAPQETPATGSDSLKSVVLSAMPQSKDGKRALAMIIASVVSLSVIVGIIIANISFYKTPPVPNARTDHETGTTIYETSTPLHRAAKPQPFNYESGFTISHDAVLSKNQNIISAVENLLSDSPDAALSSLNAVKSDYSDHPNFLRLYLAALYKVSKSKRDYKEIFNTLGALLDMTPDAWRNDHVKEIILDFANSKERHNDIIDVLSQHGTSEELAKLIISTPFERYITRKTYLLEAFDKRAPEKLSPWLETGLNIWRTDTKACQTRRELFEHFADQNNEDFYQNVILPQTKVTCQPHRFQKSDCNKCLRDYFDTIQNVRNGVVTEENAD